MRTRTAKVQIDGREFTIAPLTLGQLRELNDMHDAAGGDALKGLLVDVAAIRMSIERGQGTAPELADLERMIDAEDLLRLKLAVFKVSGVPEPGAEGKAPSP